MMMMQQQQQQMLDDKPQQAATIRQRMLLLADGGEECVWFRMKTTSEGTFERKCFVVVVACVAWMEWARTLACLLFVYLS